MNSFLLMSTSLSYHNMQMNSFCLDLIDKHFPPHKFYKLFNRNNVNVSYNCLPNLKSVINAHNKKILTQQTRKKILQLC